MRIFALSLFALVVILQYQYWLGDNGRPKILALEKGIAEQEAINAELNKRNQQLYAEVVDLREGLDAIEERARVELGMIKTDEIFYQFVDQ